QTQAPPPLLETSVGKGYTPPQLRRLLFGSLVAIVVLLTILVTLFRHLIAKLYRALLSETLFNQLYRELPSYSPVPFFALYLFSLGILSYFLFLTLHQWGIQLAPSPGKGLLLTATGLLMFFAGKHFLWALSGMLFPVGRELGAYSFLVLVFNVMLGLGLIPFTIVISYAPPPMAQGAMYLGLGAGGMLFLYRLLRGLWLTAPLLSSTPFHFLLYICAVEIAPFLVLWRYFSSHFGEF
ncbi:MAG: DUF4271 domain-containing protein, partial [Bacteroidetes bacterium]